MVITLDLETNEVVSVTDENGEPLERFTATPEHPLDLNGRLIGTSAGTMLLTRTNPCYKWFTWDGRTYYKRQVPCP
jgi:hypothetical protein